MADLTPHNPEQVELSHPEKVVQQPKSPDELLNKLKGGVERMEELDAKLDAADGRLQQKKEKRKESKVAAPKKKKIVVNWNYLISAYRHTSHLVTKNMYEAVEYLRRIRGIVLQHSENRLRKRIQSTLAATMLFFTL